MRIIFITICIFSYCFAQGQVAYEPGNLDSVGYKWVQSRLDSMSLEEKIGQLMMVRAHSDKGIAHENAIKGLIQRYHIGALCFFQGTPEKQIKLINEYQALSDIPLMVGMDAEWGLGMRFKDDAQSFPRQLMLGALRDESLIYEMGKEIGKQLRRVGVQVNFAPVVDVNNNINNPVINDRSFGDQKVSVSRKGIRYMNGLQDAGVMACAKHFPGHGDTDTDSHHALPVINHSRARLDSIELYPFRKLIESNVGSIMIAHLNVPALDSEKNKPTTLSNKVVTDLLKTDMGYKGLIFTDAMEMKGVTSHYPAGEAEALAIVAGNDVLCLPADVGKAVATIKKYVGEGKITEERLNESVRKILTAKYQLKISQDPILTDSLDKDIFSHTGDAIIRDITEKAITVVRDKNRLIPVGNLKSKNFASLAFGVKNITPFQNRMASYTRMVHFTSPKYPSDEKMKDIGDQLGNFDRVVISFHDMSKHATRNFGIVQRSVDFVKRISKSTEVIVVLFGSPYALKYFDDIEDIVVAYNEDKITQDVAAQGLFGAFSFEGALPVTASDKSKAGTGVITSNLYRLGWGVAEQVNMNSDTLALIDDLVREMISEGATPGCQVLVAKNGKIIHHEAYGYMTYEKKHPVLIDDIYDLASVTKVAATTISIMKLHDEGKISVYKPLKSYYSLSKSSNKGDMVIKDIMSHTAGLKSWIAFYKETLDAKGLPSPMYYRSTPVDGFNTKVARNLYMKDSYIDIILQEILNSGMNRPGNYVYSDLGMIMLSRMIEEVDGRSLDIYTRDNFYRPLGLRQMLYNPNRYITSGSVVPSEMDAYYRYQQIRGYVHDMGAAMLGGVSGHAGLFGNAHEVAVVFQMLLNGGYYGGNRYFKTETVELFTNRVAGQTRRGIGFDMKELDPDKSENMSPLASRHTFGHLGFTGIAVWADPEQQLIFVFLSNRTFPTMTNKKLQRGDYRPKLQSIAYRAINQLRS